MVAIERKELVKSVKVLNDCGLAKFPVDPKQGMESLISDFLSMVETVPVEKENELPDIVSNMYNTLADNKAIAEGNFDIADMALEARRKNEEIMKEIPVPDVVVVESVEPAPVEKPVKEKKVKQVEVKPKNELGIRLGSKADMAIDYVKTNPGATMYTIRQQEWNDKNDTYYNLFGKLIKDGKMKKDGKGYIVV
jgi:hypothetical protein